MIWLVLGVVLWTLSHWFKRIAPGARASMGNGGRGLVAVASLGAIVLMVIGYRAADPTPLWYVSWGIHLNNLAMIVAIVLMGVGQSKSRLRGMIRHPMLTGAVIWALSHLLVNGDTPSLILFGGMAVWALGSILLINRAETDYQPFTGGTAKGDLRLFVISAVVFVVITLIHGWIGPSPFPS